MLAKPSFGLCRFFTPKVEALAEKKICEYKNWWRNTNKSFWRVGMSSSAHDMIDVLATDVKVTEDTLTVDLSDGRTISAPLVWYPRLLNGTAKERSKWELIAKGCGIHWPKLDEDISVENLLLGQRSMEGPKSFQRWLDKRTGKNGKNGSKP